MGNIQQDFDNLYFLNYLHIQHFGGQFLKNGFKMMLDELGGNILNVYIKSFVDI